MTTWSERVEERCRQVEAEGRWRRPMAFDAAGPVGTLAGVGQVISFAGNDYLGLSHHPDVQAAAQHAVERWGTGSGASRLVTGSRPVHHELEEALAAHVSAEAAVVLPTGFAANMAVLSTFGEAGARICSDERNHASIVDGARLARAEVRVYRHGDVDHLQALVDEATGPVLVVTDSVFSMDGDEAPLAALADCCRRHGALLVLDEAHAVLGPDPLPHLVDVDWLRVGTLSKTLGSLGGFVAGTQGFVDLVVNRGRPYIFTTAPTPADAAAALAALRVLESSEGERRRERLRANIGRLLSAVEPALVAAAGPSGHGAGPEAGSVGGFGREAGPSGHGAGPEAGSVGGFGREAGSAGGAGPMPVVGARASGRGTPGALRGPSAVPATRSPIVPVVLGDEHRALAGSARLLAAGYWVPAIRPPTVPAGTARLRVTLSADHTDDAVDGLAAALRELLDMAPAPSPAPDTARAACSAPAPDVPSAACR